MILRVHPVTPQKRMVDEIVEGLKKDGVYILPTDTVYAFVCLLDAPRAINELYRLKGIPTSQHLSLLCKDLTMASNYAHGFPNHVFRFMKAVTPGPYTFILKANRQMDRRGSGKKKTVGLRIVDHPLHRALMERLDVPLVSTSITIEGEYATDPEDLDLKFGKQIKAVVDGGVRYHDFSTILDCSGDEFILKRQGIGSVEEINVIDETPDAQED